MANQRRFGFLFQKIVHRDVAARNILINKNKTAKLSDFGLCRFSGEMFDKSRGGKLPLKWMAPEAIEYAQFSTKSDVSSFGVLLYEMYSFGKTPFHSIQQEEVLAQLKMGKRMEKPEKTPELIKKLMDVCLNENPFGRPNFTEIRSKLCREMEDNQEKHNYLHFRKNYYKVITQASNGENLALDFEHF